MRLSWLKFTNFLCIGINSGQEKQNENFSNTSREDEPQRRGRQPFNQIFLWVGEEMWRYFRSSPIHVLLLLMKFREWERRSHKATAPYPLFLLATLANCKRKSARNII